MYKSILNFVIISVAVFVFPYAPSAYANHTPEHTLEEAQQQLTTIQTELFDKLLNTVAVLQMQIKQSLGTEAGTRELILLGKLQDKISELRGQLQKQLNTDF